MTFLIGIDGRWSRFAHRLSTVWRSRRDGEAVTACGVEPYGYAEDPGSVRFARADGPLCGKCAGASTLETAPEPEKRTESDDTGAAG